MPTVTFEDVAPAAAVRVVLFAVPGTRASEDGLALTPDGRPLIVTVTVPANPLAGTAFTLTISPAPPATRVTVMGDTLREKSATVGVVDLDEDPPPHERRERTSKTHATYAGVLRPGVGPFRAPFVLMNSPSDFRSCE